MPTAHVIAPHGGVPAQSSTYPFQAKARLLPRMLRARGWTVVDYSNEGSEAGADEHVRMLTAAELAEAAPGDHERIPSRHWRLYDARLTAALLDRAAPGDVVLHTFGGAHGHLVQDLPECRHVDFGVGHLDRPFGAHRIYESEAWRVYHWGLWDGLKTDYPEREHRELSWVCPMAFDPAEWPAGDGGGSAVFMARLLRSKGLGVVAAVLTAMGALAPRLVVYGQETGEFLAWLAELPSQARDRVDYRGVARGAERAAALGSAFCFLAPSQYCEPFGAAAVEAMLCGTPVAASAWGAYTETVQNRGGRLCRTLREWCDALYEAPGFDRGWVRDWAVSQFSTSAVGARLDAILREIAAL